MTPHPTRRTSTFLAAVTLATALATPASAANPTGRVEGRVVARATQRPVSGATVVVPELGVSTTSGPDGSFRFGAGFAASPPYRQITVVTTARGFGRWTLNRALLRPDDTLRLNVELRPMAWEHTQPLPRVSIRHADRDLGRGPTCTGWTAQLVPPQTITVLITADDTSQKYDFLFYVQHVLPNESITSWKPESLAAGAVAVKTYAAYRTMPGNAVRGDPNCADIRDNTQDQVFDPCCSYDSTDQASNRVLGSILWEHGGLFLSQYFAGVDGEACGPVLTGSHVGDMSQWGTQSCAKDGMAWPDITTTYYYDSPSWHYLANLLLNPDVENSPLYPWLTGASTTRTRIKGGAHSGNWYLEVDAPQTGTLYQLRPYQGTATTSYRLQTALRCGTENVVTCTVNLKVIAKTSDGDSVTARKKVTVRNDGVWRVYTFDPPDPGIAHDFVQVNFVSSEIFGVDSATLTDIS